MSNIVGPKRATTQVGLNKVLGVSPTWRHTQFDTRFEYIFDWIFKWFFYYYCCLSNPLVWSFEIKVIYNLVKLIKNSIKPFHPHPPPWRISHCCSLNSHLIRRSLLSNKLSSWLFLFWFLCSIKAWVANGKTSLRKKRDESIDWVMNKLTQINPTTL